jgi:hypothetical protein
MRENNKTQCYTHQKKTPDESTNHWAAASVSPAQEPPMRAGRSMSVAGYNYN